MAPVCTQFFGVHRPLTQRSGLGFVVLPQTYNSSDKFLAIECEQSTVLLQLLMRHAQAPSVNAALVHKHGLQTSLVECA